MVKVKSELVSAHVCLVEAAPLKELPFIVANALVKPIESNKEITVPIRLINPSADSVTLYKAQQLLVSLELILPMWWQMLIPSLQTLTLMFQKQSKRRCWNLFVEVVKG